MPVWLVTGGSGFLGGHLLSALAERRMPGVEVMALGRRLPANLPSEAFLQADLNDPSSLRPALTSTEPAVVFHTAGRTPPADPETLYLANTLATLHLLDALRALPKTTRLVLAGSAAELGPVPVGDLPVREDYPCRPGDAYGLSKWLASTAGLAARPPLEVIVARVFNPVGPGQPTSQALGRFADLLSDPGPDPLHLAVGDLDARRDFIDVRDVARALMALALLGHPGQAYHVGTGRSHRVREGLDRLIALSGRNVEVEVDPLRPRGRGPDDSRADPTRLMTHTGWRPQIGWEQSLADLWDEASVRPRLPLTGSAAPV